MYRPFRPGDLIAVRTTDPNGHETQIILDRVTDAGDVCVMAGRWGGFDLEIVGRRVGDTRPLTLESPCP